MKLKKYLFNWIKKGLCDCCKNGEFEFILTDKNGILVNVETKGGVKIPNFWICSIACNNPLCEWSKIQKEIEPLNSTSVETAWKLQDKLDGKIK